MRETHDLQAARPGWISLTAFCAICALLAINKLAPQFLNADTIIQSVMSLQNVTLFYWGQDRFANVVPFVLSPLQYPVANGFLLLFVFAFSFFALISGVAWFGARRLGATSRLDLWMSIVSLVAMVLVLLDRETIFRFAVEGQPYALSLILGGAAAWFSSKPRLIRLPFISLLIFVATGLNPSIILVAGYGAVLWAIGGNWRSAGCLVVPAVVSLFIWSLLSARYGVPSGISYVSAPMGTDEDMARSGASILAAFKMPIAIAAVSVLAVWAYFRPADTRAAKLTLSVAAFALGWLALFSGSDWVEANGFSVRYFFPVIAAAVFIIWIAFAARVLTVANDVKPFIIFGAVVISAVNLAAPPVAVRDYTVVKSTQVYAAYAIAENRQFIAGDYWRVWPTVWQAMSSGNSSFGLTYRGDGNGAGIRSAVTSASKGICLGAPIESCLADSSNLTGRVWVADEGSCGNECLLMRVDQ